jgi:hypothetical protein
MAPSTTAQFDYTPILLVTVLGITAIAAITITVTGSCPEASASQRVVQGPTGTVEGGEDVESASTGINS